MLEWGVATLEIAWPCACFILESSLGVLDTLMKVCGKQQAVHLLWTVVRVGLTAFQLMQSQTVQVQIDAFHVMGTHVGSQGM